MRNTIIVYCIRLNESTFQIKIDTERYNDKNNFNVIKYS